MKWLSIVVVSITITAAALAAPLFATGRFYSDG